MDLSQLPPGLAPALSYNSLQKGTVVAFGVTYFFCTVFLVARYFQALKLVKRVEIDLGMSEASWMDHERHSTASVTHALYSYPHTGLWRCAGILHNNGQL